KDPKNWSSVLITNARWRAKKYGLKFTLSKHDLEPVPLVCPVLGIPLEAGGHADTSPSLDRIDPTLGYVQGNVAVISWRANRLKSDATVDELTKIVEYMKGRVI